MPQDVRPKARSGKKKVAHRFVKSKYIAQLTLEDGDTVLSHVMGAHRLVVKQSIRTLLDFLSKPKSKKDILTVFGANEEQLDSLLSRLEASRLIHPTGKEAIIENIRKMYLLRFAPSSYASHSEFHTALSVIDKDVGSRPKPDSVKLQTTLILGKGLSRLPLGRGECLVTHLLSRRLHLGQDLWKLSQEFRKPTCISDIAKKHSDKYPTYKILEACRFLVNRRILWLAEQDEERAIRASFPKTDRQPLLDRYFPGYQWEEPYLPYTMECFHLPAQRAEVSIVGLCQAQNHIPAFQRLAREAGWDVEVESHLLTGDVSLSKRPWAFVILVPTPRAVDLYSSFAIGNLRKALRLLPDTLSRYDRLIDQIRSQTDAPILVHSFGRPRLSYGPASSAWVHAQNRILAEANQGLFELARDDGNIFLLDEDYVVSNIASGVFWDDEYGATAHHGNPMWKLAMFTPKNPHDRQIPSPPIPEHQSDPAYVFAKAYLEFLQRVAARDSLRVIFFEPNDVLWPGRLEGRDRPFDEPFNLAFANTFLRFTGVHEALYALKQRGVRLACVSTCPTDLLKRRWHFDSRDESVIRFDTLDHVYGGKDRDGFIRKLLKKEKLSPHEVLYIDHLNAVPKSYRGMVYRGDAWHLRRFLLTGPEIHAPAAERSSQLSATRQRLVSSSEPLETIESEAVPLPGKHPLLVPSEATITQTIYEIIATVSKCSTEEVMSVENLRHLGLSSLEGLDIVGKIEDRIHAKFRPQDLLETTVFSRAGLCEAAMDALSRAKRQVIQKRKVRWTPDEPRLGGLTHAEWSQRDMRSVLLEHIADPPTPWIFKFLRSPKPFDYEYITWQQLFDKAAAYTKLYQDLGLRSPVR